MSLSITPSSQNSFDFSRLERLSIPDTRHPFLQSIIAALTPEEAALVNLSQRSYGMKVGQFPSGYTPEQYLILITCAKRVHVAAEIYLAEFSLIEENPSCFDTVFCNLSVQAGAGLMLPICQKTDVSNMPFINRTLFSPNAFVSTRCYAYFQYLSERPHATT
jgi:hypothetical protein